MTDYTIPDLSANNTYYADLYLETWRTGWTESKKTLISTLLSDEAAARAAADAAIIAGAGLGTGGAYATNESSNYLTAALFAAAALTPNLKNADNLLDAQIKVLADLIAGFGTAIVTSTVRVTASQMKSLKFIQKELIPAPGAGKIIQLIHCTAFLDYGTAAFSFGYGLDVAYDDTIDPPNAKIGSFTQAFAEASGDSYEVMAPVNTLVTWFENSAVVLSCEDTSAVGDSGVSFYLVYKVISV